MSVLRLKNISKNKLYIIMIVVFTMISILLGCNQTVVKQSPVQTQVVEKQQAQSTIPQKAQVKEIAIEQQDTVDVYKTAGDDWSKNWNPRIRRAKYTKTAVVQDNSRIATTIDTVTDTKIEARQVQGFRVQLANVSGEEEANWIKSQASTLFDSVYVIFQRPSYKVRGGNFWNRSQADAAADSAKQLGFRDAWVVPSRVWQVKSVE